MPHPFLSPEWIDEARRIRDEHGGEAVTVPESIAVNLVVTDVPFGSGTVEAHVDTTSGAVQVDTGHVAQPDVTLTMEYATARAILVDGDASAVMQAFLGGRIKVDGDLAKVIVLQGRMATPDPTALDVAERVRAMTE